VHCFTTGFYYLNAAHRGLLSCACNLARGLLRQIAR
jgi:hypothetical protein